MLSWLQVKLNIFTLSFACSILIHSILILTLMFCGSYTPLKHTQIHTTVAELSDKIPASALLATAKQFTPIRLGALPIQIRNQMHNQVHNQVRNKVSNQVHKTTPEKLQNALHDHDKEKEREAPVEIQASMLTQEIITEPHTQTDAPVQVSVQTDVQTDNPQPAAVKEQEQKQTKQAATQTSKKNGTQNKKLAPNKPAVTTKQAPAPGQFSPLKKEHTKLLRSKERQKPRARTTPTKKEPVKKQVQTHTQIITAVKENTPIKQHIEPAISDLRDISVQEAIPETIIQKNTKETTKERAQERLPEVVPGVASVSMPVNMPDNKNTVQVAGQTSQTGPSCQRGEMGQADEKMYSTIIIPESPAEFVSSAVSVSPEQTKAYHNTLNKIYKNYSKPPGFDNSSSFTLTFKVAHVTGKPCDISPRPEQVPLLVYQSAKASISETVYPSELWGTELLVQFN